MIGASSRAMVALALLASGCGGAARQSAPPEETVVRYLDAVRAGRWDDAYALTSRAYRLDHDRADFVRTLRAHAEDLEPAASALRSAGVRVERRAEVRLPDGESLPLRFEDGAWRLEADPLDLYPQSTPREALRSFLRAIDRHRWDVALRFVPARFRRGLSVAELQARWDPNDGGKRAERAAEIAELRAHLGDPIDEREDGAVLPLGEKRQARLIREDRLWRVEALR